MGNTKAIEEGLEEMCKMNPSFKKSPCYHYYKAQTYWKRIEAPSASEINSGKHLYFIDSKSNKHFKLSNEQEYINRLSEAILGAP